MLITVQKLTGEDLIRRACSFTSRKPSNATRSVMYQCEHSPIRTQIFWVEMLDIPTFVSVHFVRHNIGVTHFVSTNRDDLTGNKGITRETLVNHAMLVNAQALINMARKRLCYKAHEKTRAVMKLITMRIACLDCDPYLATYLVPECEYRGGVCHELRTCGRILDAKV